MNNNLTRKDKQRICFTPFISSLLTMCETFAHTKDYLPKFQSISPNIENPMTYRVLLIAFAISYRGRSGGGTGGEKARGGERTVDLISTGGGGFRGDAQNAIKVAAEKRAEVPAYHGKKHARGPAKTTVQATRARPKSPDPGGEPPAGTSSRHLIMSKYEDAGRGKSSPG